MLDIEHSAHLDIDAHVRKAWVVGGSSSSAWPWALSSISLCLSTKQFSTSRYCRHEECAADQAANNHAKEASETETSTKNEMVNTPEMVINEIVVENENWSIKSKEIETEEAPVVESEVETENNTFIEQGNVNNEVVSTIESSQENVVTIKEENVNDEALAAPFPDVIITTCSGRDPV